MMKFSFEDVLEKVEYNLEHLDNGFTLPLMPELNKIVGNISSGLYTAIGGLPGTGVTSFVNQNYVMSPLLQWYNNQDQHRRELKILYFTTATNEMEKIQQLICLYSKLVHGIHIDIPTLNSKPGRLYDLDDEPVVLQSLASARAFFNDVFDHQLSLIAGELSPTSIHNKIIDELQLIDKDDTDVLVVIDSVKYLQDDVEKYGAITGKDLDKKLDRLIKDLVTKENISVTAVIPIKTGVSRFVKDSEPHYSQLRDYTNNCHRGIIIYNPIVEKHPDYMQDSKKFINPAGLNTLRTWTVVRNTEGKEMVNKSILFLPGTSFMLELASTREVDDFDDVKRLLLDPEISPFYENLTKSNDEDIETKESTDGETKKDTDVDDSSDTDEYSPDDAEPDIVLPDKKSNTKI